VSRLAVVLTIAACLGAILGYVVLEYGLAALPEFLLVAFIAIIIVPIILLTSSFWS
jgi:hypothetical protein